MLGLWLLYQQYLKRRQINNDLKITGEEEWLGNSTIFRSTIKMLTYKDALEESKQFIYNIAKVVTQRFSPDQKNIILTLGQKLVNAGVKYIHIVDIFALSLEKKISRVKILQDNKSKSQGLSK